MRQEIGLAAATAVLFATIAIRPVAQGAPQAPAGQPAAGPARGGGAPGQGGGAGRGRGPATFPAQQRPPGDPALIERGKVLYEVNCRSCHGADLRGGDMGGPNLLRSQITLNDQKGELILPIIKGSLPRMPPVPVSDNDVPAVAECNIHSVVATMRGQGSPPANAAPPPSIVVGNAAAGQAYVTKTCSGCHSAGFAGIATRIPDPMALQTYWVAGGGGGGGRGGRGGGAPAGPTPAPTTAVVTLPSGQKVEGTLVRYDDFVIAITTSDGTARSFRRNGDVPKIEVRDPRAAHQKLWPTLADKDMHDVTAYLVTLK